jgi:hypothetical protein
MITFHNDQLVPPELCRLLSQTVPEEFHVPVIFFNQPHPWTTSALGLCVRHGELVHICLNPIFNSGISRTPGSFAFSLWYRLLEVSFHEFGHVATVAERAGISGRQYRSDWRSYFYVEQLAIDWANRKLGELRDHDPRLAQPANLTGYLGARLCKVLRYLNRCSEMSVRAIAVKQWRCRQTGAQLAAGDVLAVLELSPWQYANAYAVLRSVSDGIGTVYIDQAGRRHRLYQWGDVPALGTRMVASGRLRKQDLDPSERPLWVPGDEHPDDPDDMDDPFDDMPEAA